MIAVCRFAFDHISLHRRDKTRFDRSIGKMRNMKYASVNRTEILVTGSENRRNGKNDINRPMLRGYACYA